MKITSLLQEFTVLSYAMWARTCWGAPRGERDGVIRHNLERENGNWLEKLRYFVNDQSSIQRDWVNLA